MNHNWPRWIYASCTKWFADLSPIPFYTPLTVPDQNRPSDYAQFRINGPRITQTNRSTYDLHCNISILVSSMRNEQDAYTLQRNVGKFANACVNIPIYRYGGDDTLIDCMIPSSLVNIIQYGNIQPDNPLLEAAVEITYKLSINGEI